MSLVQLTFILSYYEYKQVLFLEIPIISSTNLNECNAPIHDTVQILTKCIQRVLIAV